MRGKRGTAEHEISPTICVGEMVEALWPPDGRWYQATIIENLPGDKVKIEFSADGIVKVVRHHQIRSSTGQQVVGRKDGCTRESKEDGFDCAKSAMVDISRQRVPHAEIKLKQTEGQQTVGRDEVCTRESKEDERECTKSALVDSSRQQVPSGGIKSTQTEGQKTVGRDEVCTRERKEEERECMKSELVDSSRQLVPSGGIKPNRTEGQQTVGRDEVCIRERKEEERECVKSALVDSSRQQVPSAGIKTNQSDLDDEVFELTRQIALVGDDLLSSIINKDRDADSSVADETEDDSDADPCYEESSASSQSSSDADSANDETSFESSCEDSNAEGQQTVGRDEVCTRESKEDEGECTKSALVDSSRQQVPSGGIKPTQNWDADDGKLNTLYMGYRRLFIWQQEPVKLCTLKPKFALTACKSL